MFFTIGRRRRRPFGRSCEFRRQNGLIEILFNGLEGTMFAQGLELFAQLVELGLACHLVEAGAELIGHLPRFAHPLPQRPHQLRQVLWTYHDEGHDEHE